MSKNKILFLILLTVCLSLTACESKQTGAEVLSEKLITPQQANYQTVTAAYGEYVKNGQGAAKLAYPITEEITLKINGARFVETLVSEGDFVKEGELLAIFATEGDDIELTQQHLALERAKESLAEGKANRETKIRKAL